MKLLELIRMWRPRTVRIALVGVLVPSGAMFAQPVPPAQFHAADIAASPLRAPVEPAFDLTNTFTLEAWIYLTGNQPRSWIMGKATPINGGAGGLMLNFGLQLDDAGTNLRFASAAVFLSAPNPLPRRTWTHVAVTVDGSVTRLLINGAIVATRENSPAIASAAATPFGVGSTFDSNGQGAPGEADILMARQLRVWSVARTAAQISAAMTETLPSAPSGLVALWPLDENGGRTARDISGADRHLTKNVAIGTRRLNVLEAGPFFAPTTLTVGTALLPDPSAIELIDFDSDGDLDLIVMQVKQPPTFPGTERRVLAFRNNSGSFVEATDAVLGTIMMVNPRATWTADFNGDGRTDLFIADTGTDTLPVPGAQSRLFIQSAVGRLIDESATRLPARLSYTHDMAAADVDGDGDLDIVMGNYITDTPRIYLNNGAGFFSDPGDRMPANVASGATENPSAGFIDVNRDGRPDLVLGGNYYAPNGPNSTRPNLLLMNDGTGRFVHDPAFTIPPKLHGIEGVTVKIVSADLNGDGAPDLLLSTDSGAIVPGLQMLLHDGNGGLRDATAQLNFNYSSQDQWIVDLKVQDLNGDGLPDIVARMNSGNFSPFNYNRSILLNRGNATFVDASEAFIANTHAGMRVGDLDRDGRLDVVTLYNDRLITHRSTQPLPLALFNDVAPLFTTQPTSQTLTAGAAVLLIATATGAPTPTLQWRRNGVDLPNAVNPILTLPQTAWSHGEIYTCVATNAAGSATSAAAVLAVTSPLQIATPPVAQSAPVGGSATFSVAATGTAPLTYQWARNGVALPGATAASLTVANLQPADAGLYTVTVSNSAGAVTSAGAALGIVTTDLLAGAAFSAPEWRTIAHPNGNRYTQVLLTGPAATVTADPGKVTRLSYVDLQDDIVQIEFSGAGTLTVTLDHATGPAAPLNYNQTVQYMKGHASLLIQGAGPTTFVSAFAVGRLTSFDPTGGFDLAKPASASNDPAKNANPIFKTGVAYDGHADLARLSITSPTGQFGGILLGNVAFGDTRGLTGIIASGITVSDRIRLHDLRAFDAATPVLLLGSSPNLEDGLRITGGDLLQANGRAIRLSGVNRVLMSGGVDAHNRAEPVQVNQARVERDGVDVTPIVVIPPGP